MRSSCWRSSSGGTAGARRNWDLPPSFPSAAVEQAYAQPRVDDSKDS